MPLYFAYGSNMHQEQMKTRCGNLAKIMGKGCLKAYRLGFTHYSSVWSGGVADILPDPCAAVWGLVWNLPETGLQLLDDYEGFNRKPKIYARFHIPIEANGQTYADVWAYSVARKQGFIPPSNQYMDRLICGAEEGALPDEYIATLRTIETALQ